GQATSMRPESQERARSHARFRRHGACPVIGTEPPPSQSRGGWRRPETQPAGAAQPTAVRFVLPGSSNGSVWAIALVLTLPATWSEVPWMAAGTASRAIAIDRLVRREY